ncbi:MAG: hypothetical protein ACTSRW_12680 [Candidatus Helarchaeota archaeon]
MLTLAFLSHAVLDPLARFTYHPPEAHWNDSFWKYYHVIISMIAFVVMISFVLIEWTLVLGMFMASLFDIMDWGARFLRKYQGFHLEWYDRPFLHDFFCAPLNRLFKPLPNWNEEKKGILPEIALNIAQIIPIIWLIIVFL